MTLQVKMLDGYYCETFKFHAQLYLLSRFL